MNQLKENKEKKNQKEETRENQQQHQPSGQVRIEDIVRNPTAWKRGISRLSLYAAANVIGMTADEVNAWQRYMDESGWTFRNGEAVNWRNFRRPLRMWHKREEQIQEKRMRREANRKALVDRNDKSRVLARKAAELAVKARQDAAMWALCQDRCANAEGCGCRRGVRIPPDRQVPRQCQPEECPYYDAKEVQP